jgi:hypothetical protein
MKREKDGLQVDWWDYVIVIAALCVAAYFKSKVLGR